MTLEPVPVEDGQLIFHTVATHALRNSRLMYVSEPQTVREKLTMAEIVKKQRLMDDFISRNIIRQS